MTELPDNNREQKERKEERFPEDHKINRCYEIRKKEERSQTDSVLDTSG